MESWTNHIFYYKRYTKFNICEKKSINMDITIVIFASKTRNINVLWTAC